LIIWINQVFKKVNVLLIATIIVLTSIITVTTGMKIESSTVSLDEKVTKTTSSIQTVLLDEDFSDEFFLDNMHNTMLNLRTTRQ